MTVYLIVGLGNPGMLYENTRHNFGFRIIKRLAGKYNLDFKKQIKLQAMEAIGKILDCEVHLLMPLTYMNLSGQAVKKAVDYYKIDIKNILIVVDDADIDFEEFRLKDRGKSGGHKGLESIEQHLGTQNYARLRVGIGRETKELKEFVLDKFTKEEKEKLLGIEEKAISHIELWLEKGTQIAANVANTRIKKLQKNNEE
ncbi:MAG: aminoacyl-tRNA hydrolase [Parachlamydiales bacterium]|jgi:PTH1 family peptidyl-tRNA hydrolase